MRVSCKAHRSWIWPDPGGARRTQQGKTVSPSLLVAPAKRSGPLIVNARVVRRSGRTSLWRPDSSKVRPGDLKPSIHCLRVGLLCEDSMFYKKTSLRSPVHACPLIKSIKHESKPPSSVATSPVARAQPAAGPVLPRRDLSACPGRQDSSPKCQNFRRLPAPPPPPGPGARICRPSSALAATMPEPGHLRLRLGGGVPPVASLI